MTTRPHVTEQVPPGKAAGGGAEGDPGVYDDGCLRVEHDHYYVAYHGRPIALVRAEFLIVSRLVRDAERFVEAESIWRHVWGDRKPYNGVSLRVCISRLRGKFAPYGIRLENMVNVGYRLTLARCRRR